MSIENLIPRPTIRAALVEALEVGSVLLYGPRRVGKSTLLEQLVAYPPHGWRAVRVDLEGCLKQPIQGLAVELHAQLSAAGLAPAEEGLLDRLASVEVAGVGAEFRETNPAAEWEVVERDLLHATSILGDEARLIVALDEVPWWLDAISERAGGSAARSALAVLRRLRQRRTLADRVRLVLTGSVGLAGMASDLGASAEINDLSTLILDPMTIEEGAALFETELAGRSRPCAPPVARLASVLAGGSPHWVKVLAASVGPRGAQSEQDLERAVQSLLVPAQRKNFADEGSEHLRRRHGHFRAALIGILDAVSHADSGHPFEAALTAALAAQPELSRVRARECVFLLIDGFYLAMAPDGILRWVNPLFRRWWQLYGGL
jgi:hypothetical protein